MRLSPQYIFLGIVTLGLPFAITVGWTLGAPPPAPQPVSAPAGAGGLGGPDGWGSAPQRGTSAPGTGHDQPARDARTAPPRSNPSTAPVAATPSAAAPDDRTTPPLQLPLTDPPVPTPTTVTSESPAPSAAPSETTPPDSGDSVAERLMRRP